MEGGEDKLRRPDQVSNPLETWGGNSSSSMPDGKREDIKKATEENVTQKDGLSEEDQGLVKRLVEQEEFYSAVKDANIHYAAALAVKEIKNQLKTQGQGNHQRSLLSRVRSIKQEMLELEDSIPWTCVKKVWKNKRASWRRQVRQVELVAGFAFKMKELKQALLIDDSALLGCGPSWNAKLDLCMQGIGSATQLSGVWDDMKGSILSWIHGSQINRTGEVDSLPASVAVKAMHSALQSGHGSLLQVPIESMMGVESERILGLRHAVELERQKIIGGRQGHDILEHFQEEDHFDSGAETDDEAATDIDDRYDVFLFQNDRSQ